MNQHQTPEIVIKNDDFYHGLKLDAVTVKWDDPKLQFALQRLFGVRDGAVIRGLVVNRDGLHADVEHPKPQASSPSYQHNNR